MTLLAALGVFLAAAVVVRIAVHCLAAHRPGNRFVPWTALALGQAALLLTVPSLLAAAGGSRLWTPLLALGLAALVGAAYSPAVRRRLERWVPPPGALMRTRPMRRGFGLLELTVRAGSPFAWRSVAEAEFESAGIALLAIEQSDGTFDEDPGLSKLIRPGDTLILYGPQARLEGLYARRLVPAGPRSA